MTNALVPTSCPPETATLGTAPFAAATGSTSFTERLAGRDLVFIDLEMSGGDCLKHDIIDIGAVRSQLPRLPARGELAVKTKLRSLRSSEKEALRITGYSTKAWKDAVEIDEGLLRLRRFAEGCIAVGWSFHNDLLFLDAATERLGLEPFFPEGYIELQDWAQARFGHSSKPNLHNQAHRLKIPHDGPHAGLADADVTCEIFRMLWRFGPNELAEEIRRMDWNSYLSLSGDIDLDEATVAERIDELSAFFVGERSKQSLLSRSPVNANRGRKARRY